MAHEYRIVEVAQIDASTLERLVLLSEPWLSLGYVKDDLVKLARASTTNECLLAYAREVSVGLAMFKPDFLGGYYLQLLSVAAEHRRHGLGRALMTEVETRVFRSRPHVFLTVTGSNQPARAFYAALGYQEIGAIPDLLVPGEAEVLLRKSVGSTRTFRGRAS